MGPFWWVQLWTEHWKSWVEPPLLPFHDTYNSISRPLWRYKYTKFVMQEEKKKKDFGKMKLGMSEVKINN